MELKAVIIDDELNSIDILKILLGKYCPEVKVLAQASSADAGREILSAYSPDVVFLDIEMPSASGFDMLDNTDIKPLQVIFITAYNHYALKAIKYCALDYLLKPVDIDELVMAVSKVSERILCQDARDAIGSLKSFLKRSGNKIAIPTADGLQFVSVRDIVRFEASGNYTRIHLLNGANHLITRTLKDFEELLYQHDFLRVHHAHLINLDHIEKYVKGDGGYAVMADGSSVDISKRKKPEFLTRFSQGT